MSSLGKVEHAYVLDTNALIWYLKNDKKLSPSAAIIFQAAERGETVLIVSAIVVAELFYADKKWGLFQDFAKTYADLKARPYFQFVPFLPDDVLEFAQDSAVAEMHDRMIAGLARRLGFSLITSDSNITTSRLVQVVW